MIGGTEIAKAIRTAVKDGFDDMSQRSKHILLITDAEDHGYAAAGEAGRAGIRLNAAGPGDEVNGARVEGFWIPLALAVASLAAELALSDRRRG